MPFDHPLYVLYSSGTTGLPKPIVHGHGGILLEHLKMLALHHDLGPGDRFFWFTTTGWMMWNFLVSGPAVGAAIVLFDGNPGHPDLGALWRLAEEAGITYFGTSAPFLLACRKAGIVPKEIADLSALRGVGSTGAPLPAEGFRWVYEAVGDRLAAPVALRRHRRLHRLRRRRRRCCRCTPVRSPAAAWARRWRPRPGRGTPVIGELGELVITAPMPSMPVGFWNDPDGARYREAYFDVFPGVWRHGDWITITERGGCVITGRSDATLNRGGVRLGTAEFYSVVEGLDEVRRLGGGAPGGRPRAARASCCCSWCSPTGLELDDALRARIARELRTALSPRHVPDEIHQVRAVPRTLSAKKLEVPVKRILTGTPVDSARPPRAPWPTPSPWPPSPPSPSAASTPTTRLAPRAGPRSGSGGSVRVAAPLAVRAAAARGAERRLRLTSRCGLRRPAGAATVVDRRRAAVVAEHGGRQD